MSSAQAVSNVLTLRGSTDIVTEFFDFAVNAILYQRGIYPPETFKKVPKYGLSMMVTTDEGLFAYMANICRQLDGEYRFQLKLCRAANQTPVDLML
jgi:mitotic spindle assembly checkpoint protein MAD2